MSHDDVDAPEGQRAFIRSTIWKIIEENKVRIGTAYAAAEAEGRVPRRSNDYKMDAQR